MSLWGLLSEHRAEDGGVRVCVTHMDVYIGYVFCVLISVCVC